MSESRQLIIVKLKEDINKEQLEIIRNSFRNLRESSDQFDFLITIDAVEQIYTEKKMYPVFKSDEVEVYGVHADGVINGEDFSFDKSNTQ